MPSVRYDSGMAQRAQEAHTDSEEALKRLRLERPNRGTAGTGTKAVEPEEAHKPARGPVPGGTRTTFGKTRTLPSGAVRASYVRFGVTHTPGHTFANEKAALAWLNAEKVLIDREQWTPPADRRKREEISSLTFGDYSGEWIAQRLVKGRPIKDRTREHYADIRARWFTPLLTRPLASITRAEVAAWFRALPDKPTMRQHAYALLRSIFRTAVNDGLVATNPVQVEGASARPEPSDVEIFTEDEVARLAELMPERHRVIILLAAWCALRFGEVAALRRSDFSEKDGYLMLKVSRGVVTVGHKRVETTPKSSSAVRRLVVPPHIAEAVKQHLQAFAQPGPDGLLFPPQRDTGFITPLEVYGEDPSKPRKDRKGKTRTGSGYYLARVQLGRPDLTFHRLRHFGLTKYAEVGVTQREAMAYGGHSDPKTAQRYQHAAERRAITLAERMGALAGEGR